MVGAILIMELEFKNSQGSHEINQILIKKKVTYVRQNWRVLAYHAGKIHRASGRSSQKRIYSANWHNSIRIFP